MTNEKAISWKELYGNKLRFSPCPQMLCAGYQVKMSTKIAGESKNVSVPVTVTFDRGYVIEYLANICAKLQLNDDDWMQLTREAFLEHEAKQM